MNHPNEWNKKSTKRIQDVKNHPQTDNSKLFMTKMVTSDKHKSRSTAYDSNEQAHLNA